MIIRKDNLESIGGPSFLKAAVGKRSFRYFVSRVSMAVANTALAAYSAIVFVLFDFQFMPGLLAELRHNRFDFSGVYLSYSGCFHRMVYT